MSDIEFEGFVVGDTNSKVRVRCRRVDGSIIDLSGSTLTFRYRINTGSLVSRTMVVESPATNAFANYTFIAGELTEAGYLRGEVEILNSSLIVSNSKIFYIPIRGKV